MYISYKFALFGDNRLYDPKHVVMYICGAIVKNGNPCKKKIMLSRLDA